VSDILYSLFEFSAEIFDLTHNVLVRGRFDNTERKGNGDSKQQRKLDKEITGSYTTVYMLENDDVVLSTDKTAEIHRISGIKRFEHTFDNSIIKILPSSSSKDYIFVQNGMVEDVRLR
jgi:hypothetical protein